MDNDKRNEPVKIYFKEEIKPKKINLKVAPGNWNRMKRYIQEYNETRTGQKLNYTDVINIAIGRYFEEKNDD